MLEPLLGIEALLLGEAAVVRRHVLLAEQLRELARCPFGHSARIDENERRSVFPNQIRQAPVDLVPDLRRHHRFERRIGDFQGQVARATVARIHDHGSLVGHPPDADQKPRDIFDRLLRRREADAERTIAAERGKPFEG